MVARGRSIERRRNLRGTSRSISKGKKGKQKHWDYNKLGNLKKYCWKCKNPMMNPQRMQVWLVETSADTVDEVLYVCNNSQYH